MTELTTRKLASVAPGPARPCRVLLIIESSGGGTGRHVLDLAEGLAERGCEVHLIYSTGRAEGLFLARLARLRGVRQHPLPMRTAVHPADLRVVWMVRGYMRRHGPFHVVHGHSSKGGAIARLAAFATGAAAVYTIHGLLMLDPSVFAWKRWAYQAIEVALSRVTARVIAVAPEEGRAAVRCGLGRSRVVVVPNGVGPGWLAPRDVARAALGASAGETVIGFVGRLVGAKAPEVLVRAFALVVSEAPHARLALVGSGPLHAELRSLAASLGVSDRVRFLGERDSREVLAGFDTLALSSRKEGLPYVVLEAMAAGLPIVATASAGVELLVEPGRNGEVVPTDDVVTLAGALTRLANDPARRARYGRASRALVGMFSIDRMVEGTLAAYGRAATATGAAEQTQRPSRDPAHAQTALTLSLPKGAPMTAKPRSSELHPGPGFRVRTNFRRLDANLMEEFREFASPDVSDLLNRLYAVDPAIRSLSGDHHALYGPACTVKVFPGDNLMVHKALDVAQPGDVVVVDAGGATTNAVLGDLISAKAQHRGIAGFVVDGLVRDLPSIRELDFPVFARGTTPIGPLHRGPGEINYPICCGGIVVNPGDLIVADAAGVIVVPREIATELLGRLKGHQEANRAYLEAVRRGEFSNQWVDRVLDDQHCPTVDPDDSDPEAETPSGWGAAWAPERAGAVPLLDGSRDPL